MGQVKEEFANIDNGERTERGAANGVGVGTLRLIAGPTAKELQNLISRYNSIKTNNKGTSAQHTEKVACKKYTFDQYGVVASAFDFLVDPERFFLRFGEIKGLQRATDVTCRERSSRRRGRVEEI